MKRILIILIMVALVTTVSACASQKMASIPEKESSYTAVGTQVNKDSSGKEVIVSENPSKNNESNPQNPTDSSNKETSTSNETLENTAKQNNQAFLENG